LLEYLLKNGSWFFVNELRDNSYKVREFTNYLKFVDDVERGSQVRAISKRIMDLLRNTE